MRITDKRNGEPVGRVLAHPLQREFERSLTRVLGSQENWKVGDRISMIEFNNAQNKEFVRTRLESLGFMLGRDVSTYVYIGQAGEDRRRNLILEVEAARLNPAQKYYTADIRDFFGRHNALTTKGLDSENRQRISCAVSYLRTREGYDIQSVRKREGMATHVTYYLQ